MPVVNRKDRKWGELYEEEDGEQSKWYPIHKAQGEILNSRSRYTGAIAGTGGGKTAVGALWLAKQVSKAPTGKFLVVAPTYKIMADAALATWKTTVEGTAHKGVFKQNEANYYLPSGGVIYFRSADDPDSFEGVHVNAAWVDEAGRISQRAWQNVTKRCGQKRAPILITTTPYSFNWLYNDFFARFKAGDKDYFVKQWASIENPEYSADHFDKEKKNQSDHYFAMQYEGQFQRAAGIVYPKMIDCVVREEDLDEFPTGKFVGGIDFGWNDPFAGIAGILDNDDVLWLCYERYIRRQTLEEHAAELPKTVKWFADAARPDNIKSLRRMGFNCRKCKKGSGSIQTGIELVQARINSGRLRIIAGKVSALLEEAEMYRYPDKDEDTYGDLPIDQNNHAMDALRYLITALDRRRSFGSEELDKESND